MSTPYERLLAEEIPTGQFGGPIPDQPQPPHLPDHLEPTTKEDQIRHYAALAHALAGWNDGEHDPRRRLTAVPETADQAPGKAA
ncbi:hypothetical protein GCM10010400_58230 [Streptomyces aculeolatus]|uniref:hypothetical protein n=1 Tax=Streptomyces aculeolatus TaxID=270689 RepID=UPI001CED5C97|nr:hypothetical protein [Streptomyces aculeolatus]